MAVKWMMKHPDGAPVSYEHFDFIGKLFGLSTIETR
jgi:hypothetical protein